MSKKPERMGTPATIDMRSHTFESAPDAEGWVVSGTWIETKTAIRFTSFTILNANPDNESEVTWDVLRSNLRMRELRNDIYTYMREYFEEALREGSKLLAFLRDKGSSVQLEIAERIVSQWNDISTHVEPVKPNVGGRPRTTFDERQQWALDLLAAVDESESTFSELLRARWRKSDGTTLAFSTIKHRITQLKRDGLITGNAPNYSATDRLIAHQKGM